MSEKLEFVELKRVISSILLSVPSGRTQKQLLDDYKKLLGRDLPYRAHGYKTLLACLEDMHDSVRIERNGLDCVLFGVSNESTRHIQKLISRQKSSFASRGRPKETIHAVVVPERFRAHVRELLTSYPDGLRFDRFIEAYAKRFGCYANYRSWGFHSLDHVLGSMPDVVTCQRDNSKNALIIRLSKRTTQPTVASLSRQPGAHSNQESSLNSLELTPDDFRTNEKQASPSVPANIEIRVEQLLADRCSGIWASKFAAEYKVRFGEDLPYKENVVGFLSSLKACELQSDPNTSDWLVWSSEKKHSKEQGVPEELSVAINTMVAKHQKGIPLDKFKQVFKEECGQELLFSPYGFFSVAEMLVHVPGVRVEKPSTCLEVMVLPAQRCVAGVTGAAVEEHMSEKPKVPKVGLEHSLTGYGVQPHPSEKICPVYVSYVKSPSCLYVQIIGETTTKALESLSEEMSQFYSSKEGGKYTVESIKIGQVCCTVYSEDCYWYRAEVLDMPCPDVVRVKYIDYGNIGLVPRVTLRRPKAHYMLLPAQALKCRLANLKPASEKWCERASLLLGTMTKDRPLVATITSVRNNILSLYLCDTNTDKDIHISDRLIDQGLAIVAMDAEDDEAGFDGIHLEPPPSMSSEDVANIRPPSCPIPPSSLPSAETLAYFQQALWQLGQLAQIPPPSFNTPVAMSTNTPSINTSSQSLVPSSSSTLIPHSCSANLLHVTNGGSMDSGANGRSMDSGANGRSMDSGANGGSMDSGANGGSMDIGANGGSMDSGANGGSMDSGAMKEPTEAMKDLSRDSKDRSDWLRDSRDSVGNSTCSNGLVSKCRPSPSKSGDSRPSPSKSGDSTALQVQTHSHQFVRRVQLTSTHTLHILNHGQKALVLSSEVSSWFWNTDQLKSRLQQSSKQIWAQVLSRSRAPQLFTELSDTKLIKSSETSLITYSLEDLPAIVQTFGGPEELGVSVRKESLLWKSSPTTYFSCVGSEEEEMSLFENQLQDLHIQRSHIIKQLSDISLYEELGDVPNNLIHIEDQIRSLKNKMGIKPEMKDKVPSHLTNYVSKCVPLQSNQSTPTQPNQSVKSTPTQPDQSVKSTPTQPDQSVKSTLTLPNPSVKSTPTQPDSCDPEAPVVTSKETLQVRRPKLPGLGRGTPYINSTYTEHKL